MEKNIIFTEQELEFLIYQLEIAQRDLMSKTAEKIMEQILYKLNEA